MNKPIEEMKTIVLKEFGEDYYAENVTYLLGQILETNVRYQKFFEN